MSILSAENLHKKFKFKEVVKGISFEINSGEVVGLLGPNGAGKTTAFYMVVGLVDANEGRVILDGNYRTEARRQPCFEAAAALGVPCLLLVCNTRMV